MSAGSPTPATPGPGWCGSPNAARPPSRWPGRPRPRSRPSGPGTSAGPAPPSSAARLPACARSPTPTSSPREGPRGLGSRPEAVDDQVEDPGGPGLAAAGRVDPPQHAELQQHVLRIQPGLERPVGGPGLEQDGDGPDERLVVLVIKPAARRRVDDLGGAELELPVAGDLVEPEPQRRQRGVRLEQH